MSERSDPVLNPDPTWIKVLDPTPDQDPTTLVQLIFLFFLFFRYVRMHNCPFQGFPFPPSFYCFKY
jgi:hypothetical protein